MRIPIYMGLAQAMQELSGVMHKFHKAFNDQARRLVLQLEATKKRMGEA